MCYFWGWSRVHKLVFGLLIQTKNFCFQIIARSCTFEFVMVWFPTITQSQPNCPTLKGCDCCWAVTIVPLAYLYHSRLCSIAAKHEQNKHESETFHADLLTVSDQRHVGNQQLLLTKRSVESKGLNSAYFRKSSNQRTLGATVPRTIEQPPIN